jgi:hypothetical protein
MAFKLTTEFHGLMVLVSAPDGKTADVVAVNGSISDAGPHQTRLAMDAAALSSEEGDVAPDEYVVVPGGARMAIWNLSHVEVSFHRVTETDLKLADAYKDKDDPPEAPADVNDAKLWADARWLGSVSQAASKDGKDHCYVDPDFLRPHSDGHSGCESPTDALIRMDKGVVAVGRPYSTILREKVCEFTDTVTTSHTRALSDHFMLTTNHTDLAVIGLKPFGGGTRYIRAQPPDGGTELRIALSALPSLRHSHHARTPGLVSTIAHFQAYYSLLKDPIRKRIPVIKTGAISSTECPPALARRG